MFFLICRCSPFSSYAIHIVDNSTAPPNNKKVDDRLDILLQVKNTVGECDCILTRDISELIDREADILNRGRSVETLSGLRKRLSNLFMQYIEAPEFNPESNRFLKVPREIETFVKIKSRASC